MDREYTWPFQLLILIVMQVSNLLMLFCWGFFPSALLVLLQDSLLATASSPKFSELVMKVKLK